MNWKSFALGAVIGLSILPLVAIAEVAAGYAIGPLICLASMTAGLF